MSAESGRADRIDERGIAQLELLGEERVIGGEAGRPPTSRGPERVAPAAASDDPRACAACGRPLSGG